MNGPLLEVRNLSGDYLADVNLTVRAGEILALVGPNGAGKTTLIETIIGLRSAKSGNILLAGSEIDSLAPQRRARHGIGFAPQGRRLFPGISVRDTLLLASFAGPRQRAAAFERVLSLFADMKPRLEANAWQLSGGQQQMLSIGRALMSEPRLLLLDEPSTGLAPRLVSSVMSVLPSIAETGTAVLVAEQNARAVLAVADRACVLDAGRVVREGTPDEIRADPMWNAAFLSEPG